MGLPVSRKPPCKLEAMPIPQSESGRRSSVRAGFLSHRPSHTLRAGVPVTAPHAPSGVSTLGSQSQPLLSQAFLSTGLSDPPLSCSLAPHPPPPAPPRGSLVGHSLWPAFSRGHGEESQQSPQHVVIMELVFLPLSVPCLHLVLLVEEVLAAATENGGHE